LHVPKTADEPHALFATLIFFGGYGDAADYYQKTLAPMSDDLEFVLVVPHMPWFREPGKADEEQILDSLNQLKTELETRFHTDPKLGIVSGASKGGPITCELASRWSSAVPLLILHSTYFCSTKNSARTLHLVGEKEVAFLGHEGQSGKVLGVARKDLYAVPNEEHGAHFRHMKAWLETELSAVRLERANETLRLAQKEPTQAGLVLRSTKAAARYLSENLPESDDFMKYQNARRKELLSKFQEQIATINGAK
jgi:hypothetical protein